MKTIELSNPVSMSSREIAELTGKSHKHVLTDIRSMYNELGTEPKFGLSEYSDTTGRILPMYQLSKKYTLCLIGKYSSVLRMKILDKLEELESGNTDLRKRVKETYDMLQAIKTNGSIWGKAGAQQRKSKQEAKILMSELIEKAQISLF